jgi:hypothetical protein
MQKLVTVDTALKPEAQDIAEGFVDHSSAKVRTAAKRLLR